MTARLAALALIATAGTVAPAAGDTLDRAFATRYETPEDVFILGEYIRTASSAGEYDQAISSLEEHLVRFANDGHARLTVARLYANTSSWDLARDQARAAIASGQLSAGEIREAEALARRAALAANGVEWFVDVGGGIRVTHIDVGTENGSWRDRTATGPYAQIAAALRYDLGSPLGHALVLAGSLDYRREYQDAFTGSAPLSGLPDGRTVNATSGRASATLDLGLPVTAIDAVRLQFGAVSGYATIHPGIVIRSFGGVARMVVKPTVDTRLYAEYGYDDLSASDGIDGDYRHRWEAGAGLRLSPAHALGVAARGLYDFANGGAETARLEEGEIIYSGRLPFQPLDLVWTHRISIAAGTFSTRGLPPGPADRASGNHWRGEWDHQFHIDGNSRIEFGYSLTARDYDQSSIADREALTHAVSLGYAHRF